MSRPGMGASDILLVAVNAGYVHPGFGLRCVLANLGPLAARAELIETDVQESTPLQLVERLLARAPRLVAFSVYIWNAVFVAATLRLLRTLAPEVAVALGGPQIVAGRPNGELEAIADVLLCGEVEGLVAGVFADLLDGRRGLGTIVAPAPDLATVALPYDLYCARDLATRVVYVESARGCPFACAYCTSGDGGGVRAFPAERLFPALERLLARGVRALKFLDRAFNHGGNAALAVLDFLRRHGGSALALHLEFTPWPLSEAWRERLRRFAPGALHIEVGIQTLDPAVGRRIRRGVDPAAIDAALRTLREDARASVHADLIAGLPGETLGGFAAGFDWLLARQPAELQVGLLKRLPGTEIDRRADEFGLRFAPDPPYEALVTDRLSFGDTRRLARFARCWELLHNRGRFPHALPWLWADGASPFQRVMAVADWVQAHHGRLHALAPRQLAEAMRAIAPSASLDAALERDARLHGRAAQRANAGFVVDGGKPPE